MDKLKKKKLIELIIAIVICVVIVAIPFTIMQISKNQSNVEDNLASSGSQNQDITDTPSGDNKPNKEPAKVTDVTITISISCDRLFGENGKKYIDDVKLAMGDKLFASLNNGKMLDTTTFHMKSNNTVLDVMRLIDKDMGIKMNIMEYGYIASIGGLRQKMAGNMSGWVYTVNDKRVNVGAGGKSLSDGDVIKWFYVVGDSL